MKSSHRRPFAIFFLSFMLMLVLTAVSMGAVTAYFAGSPAETAADPEPQDPVVSSTVQRKDDVPGSITPLDKNSHPIEVELATDKGLVAPDFSGIYLGSKVERGQNSPNSTNEACEQLLINTELNVSGGSVAPWVILDQFVYYSDTQYVSPQYSLLFADNDSGDPSPNQDAFGQAFKMPSNLTEVTIKYATASTNSNTPDEAFGNLWTIDKDGNLDQFLLGWEIGQSPGEWQTQTVIITDKADLQLLQGKDLAIILFNSTTGSDPGEVVFFDDISFTACSQGETAGPAIDVWQGDTKKFGQIGNPQQWVNILGNVARLDATDSLTYSLNGGVDQPLAIGPDGFRLQAAGDFNVEIDYADLDPGENEIVIKASDGISETEKTVTVNYTAGQIWPSDYSVAWDSSADIQDIAQAVDGNWQLDGASVIIDADNWGYERLLAIGDETWTDYEVTVPITVYGLDPAGNQGVSNGSAVGLMMHWLGHNNIASEQPNVGWSRSGALGWYRWAPDGTEALDLRNLQGQIGISFNKVLEFGTPYIFKMSVQSVPDKPAYYRLKFWKASEDEPFDWDVQGYTNELASDRGSLLLVAHHVDARFGEITVKDLETLRLKVNVTIDGQGTTTFTPDQEDFGYSERVLVKAFPEYGHDFTGWTGDYTGTGNPAEFNIFRDMNLTATFVPKPPQLLTVHTDGEGSVSRDPDKTDYDWGEEVVLTAEPGADTVFLHWSGDLSGRSNPSAIIMDGDKEVTAVFGLKSEATPKSDNFGLCELDTAVWTLFNPAGDAELAMTGTAAEFKIPAAVTHDMWFNNSDALRITQPTDDQNFELEVKFDTLPTEAGQKEGILVEQDSDSWLSFMLYDNGTSLAVSAIVNGGGNSNIVHTSAIDPGGAETVYIKVGRNGHEWTHSYSLNGTDWTRAVTFVHEMEVTSSGVFVGNSGLVEGDEPAFDAQVDYFMNTAVPVANPGLGSITIEKQADDLPDSSFEFAGDFGRFSLGVGESQEFSGLCAAGYTIREVPVNEWVLRPIECDSVNIEGNIYEMTVNLQPGENVTCTFINYPRPPSSENVEFIGHIGGNILAVAAQGDYAYVGDGPKLSILDITNPSDPVLIGTSAVLPEVVWDVGVEGDYAYVAAGLGGLRIIDISDPAAPVEVGFFYATDEVFGLDVKGNLVYIADGNAGLRAIDVSDPTSPVEAGAFRTPGMARDVEIAGDYAYVADYFMGLRVIDISNPDAMHEVGSFVKSGWDAAWDVAVFGNKVYLAYGGLHVIDISDPQNPAEYGFYDSPGTARGVFADAASVYLADSIAGLVIIDGSIPGSPPVLGVYETPGTATSVAVSRNYAYVAADYAGLHIVDVSSAELPTAAGTYETVGGVGSVTIVGDLAYFATTAGLNIFDVSNPAAPAATGFLPGNYGPAAISGNYAFVAAWSDGLYVIDVTDPAAPFRTGAIDTPGLAGEVAISGNHVYVADRSGGLRVIDVSDPTNPLDVTVNNSLGDVRVVAIAGNYAYVGDMDSGILRIVDITDPTNPIEAGFYALPDWFITDLVVSGNYAYVANGGLLRIIDVSNPNSPTEVGSFVSVEGVESVYVDGNYAYVADGRYGGLRVALISNPEAPREVGFYDTPGHATGVTVANDYAFVGDSWTGLIILQYTGHSSITIEKETSVEDKTSFFFSSDLGSFALEDGASELFAELDPGDYTITEEDVTGWYLEGVECDSENITLLEDGVSIFLDVAEDITCTFANRRLTVTADAGGLYNGKEGEPILMDGSGSTNPNMITWYRWDCTGDGSWDETSRAPDDCSCTYADNGTYTLRMRTVDIFSQTSTDTAQVKVENVAPVVDAGKDQTAVAGTEVRFAGSFYDPGRDDTFTIKWYFGDGSTESGTLSPGHSYPNSGQYIVKLTVTDNDGGQGSAELVVDVVNSAPTMSDIKVSPAEINEGEIFILSGKMSDSSTVGKLTLEVDWGDGHTASREYAAGTTTFTLSHTCVDDAPGGMPADSMTINLKLSDEAGAFTTSTAVIKVSNVAPTVAIGSDRSAFVGESLNFGAVITDPGVGDTHTVSWNFGDGSPGVSGVYADHTFARPGLYIVCATVKDDDGGIGRAMIKVEVRVINYLSMIAR